MANRIGCVWLLLALVMPAGAWGDDVTVRVATFNIENFNGTSPQFEAARDVLLRVGADVVCLQEISGVAALNALAVVSGYDYYELAESGGDIDTGNDLAAVMSKTPFVMLSHSTETAAEISGDSGARDITRNFILATIEVPGAAEDLVITGNHWKAGSSDADEFRRSIESIRAMGVVEQYDSAVIPFLIVGDMNDDLSDSPDNPSHFSSVPSGMPGTFELGSDIVFPVANGVFLPLLAGTGPSHVTVISALQLVSQSGEPGDSTRPASGRRLDYLWHSDAITVAGSEVYDSRDEGAGGLPKFGSPPAYAASTTASDHLLVFADITLAAAPPETGACCHSGDVCEEVTPAECDGLGGLFHGLGSACTDELDPPCTTLGACCQPGGICDDQADEPACSAAGGYFYGLGSTCQDLLDPPCAPPGACCRPGGVCEDGLEALACAAVDGFFYGAGTSCDGPLDPPCEQVLTSLLINEVLASHPGETKEFLELYGPASGSLDGFSLVVIEGQTSSKGVVDDVVSLSGHSLASDGYFVMGEPGLADPPAPQVEPDLVVGSINFFENGSQSILLVEGYTAPPGNDVDADNDGLADVSIGTIVDSIGLVGGSGYPDYAIYYGAPEIGPQASAFPGGAARIPNGIDTDTAADWSYLSRALDGSDGDQPVTPGQANSGDGDFDDDGDVDLTDFRFFQECFTGAGGGPPPTGCEDGDLDADSDVDLDDLGILAAVLVGP